MLTSYSGNVYGPVEVGHIFILSGKTVDGASNFVIDLAGGKLAGAEIPLHIKVQFHSETIARNSLVEEQWGHEEVEENLLSSSNPIMAGWNFKFLILTGDERFHISINDQQFCTFQYRLPLHLIRTIHIDGDVQKIFQVDHRRVFPSPWPLLHENPRPPQFQSYDTPRPFCIGHVFVLAAIPFGNPNGNFIIDLNDGASKRVMFHLSARFNQRVIVVNSKTDSLEWRKDEERYQFPFAIDQLFKLGIAFTDNAFVLAVDGETIGNYSYKVSNSFLENLSGIKMLTNNGIQLEVQSIDHFNMGSSDCEGFESYTHPEVQLN